MKSAFISGITGQDGAYLAKLLLEKGYKVYGGVRRSSSSSRGRLEELNIHNDIEIISFELLEQSNISNTIRKIKPDEFYNLAAQSFVGTSFEQPIYTSLTTGLSVNYILEAIKSESPQTKFYQASTSEMFGGIKDAPQSEQTPFYPRSPYGVAKLYSHWMTTNYRESYGLFACSGILFNHESPLRGEQFVTKKITKNIAAIKLGLIDKFSLGNLYAKRDWGFAGDYVEGMWRILNHDTPKDFVLATGETHTIKEFVELAFKRAEIPYRWDGAGLQEKAIHQETGKVILEINEKYYRPAEVDLLMGDSTAAREVLGWRPEVNFEGLVSMMLDHDISKLRATL